MSPRGYAFITGGSSGIGAIYADRLARRGFDLILVARRKDRLEDVASRVRSETGRAVETLVADLADAADLLRVEAQLREDGRVTMLVNNAGIGATGPLLESDVDKMSAVIALNANALMRLTYAAVPGFVDRGGGTIINISSIVAIGPEILNGVYGGSKAFVLAFSHNLRAELADKGIRVQVVMPGATATELWAIAGTPVDHLPKKIVMPPAAMVDAALAGLDLGEFVTIPALPDMAAWEAYESARQILRPQLSRAEAAPRYQIAAGRDQIGARAVR